MDEQKDLEKDFGIKNPTKKEYKTLDSGKRQEYKTGMTRDLQDGKPNLWLWIPKDIPYEHQWLTRVGALATRGAEKYGVRNMDLACTEEELERFKSSFLRHSLQFLSGEEDEDHFAAVIFNAVQIENVKYRLKNKNRNL